MTKIKIKSLFVIFFLFALNAQANPNSLEGKKLERSAKLWIIDKDSEMFGEKIKMEISVYSSENNRSRDEIVTFQLCDFQNCEYVGKAMNLNAMPSMPNSRQNEDGKPMTGAVIGWVGGMAAFGTCTFIKRCDKWLQVAIQKLAQGDSSKFLAGTFLASAAVGAGGGYVLQTRDTSDFQRFMMIYPRFFQGIVDDSTLQVESIDDFLEQLSAYQTETTNDRN